MTTENQDDMDANRVMDVREVPCSIKHGLILQTWRDLPVGGSFVLRNGHDPVPLRYQIEAEYPGSLQWDYVARAADDVSVKLTKVRETAGPAVAFTSSCGSH
jgi:uncharacterized protein (DUF2249 family)